MSEILSRRDFLKIGGVGAAVSAVLTGCGPMSRYIVRRPYTQMPEYNQTGMSTYYASTCRECPAGCGILVRTKEGRAITIEGNPNHPVNRGRLCARGLTAQQGLYNPDRVRSPLHQGRKNSLSGSVISWEEAIMRVGEAISGPPESLAFLLGAAHDHLYDLVTELTRSLGAPAPLRYSALTSFEARNTLLKAVSLVFGRAGLPYFDLANADVAFSFGANFLENWLSPVSYAQAYGQFRRADPIRRGYFVVFEPRMSMTAGNADQWIPIKPGSEGILALAFNKLVAEARGVPVPAAARSVSISAAAEMTGVAEEKLRSLAALFARASSPLAIPGGSALAQKGGLDTALAVLQLNVITGNLGKPGGMYLSFGEETPTSLEAVKELVSRMKAGKVRALLIHGVNPVFELPGAVGFTEALANVPLVISFASFPDETALLSDYILPDHTPLESFGYKRSLPGSDRQAWSAAQPAVVPLYDTRATADVLIAASGGRLNYTDEVDFIQQQIVPLIAAGGFYTAAEIQTFWTQWLQYGGWWTENAGLLDPGEAAPIPASLNLGRSEPLQEGQQFYLLTYPNNLGDGSGANRPWLQEIPDPMTTVTWNSWVEIHPETADRLGIHDDDVVRITTAYGSIEAVVYRYPAIRPDTIAVPFGQGHTALGRWAENRGANPAQLLPAEVNEAGDLVFGTVTASITPTGKRRPLARVESITGVYGGH